MPNDARDVLPQVFRLEHRHEAGAHVLALQGELDIATADRLVEALADVPDDASLLVVDLGGVSFLDSSGLRGLLLVRRQCEERGLELAVCHDPTIHGPIFELTQLQDDLPLVERGELSARLAERA